MSAFFEGGWVTLSAHFRGKEASPTNHCWYQSSSVITLLCGIKMSAVHHLVLSQSTRVTDRRTNRIMTPKTALASARAVKVQKCSKMRKCKSLNCKIIKSGKSIGLSQSRYVLQQCIMQVSVLLQLSATMPHVNILNIYLLWILMSSSINYLEL